jgi:hypothetical protein
MLYSSRQLLLAGITLFLTACQSTTPPGEANAGEPRVASGVQSTGGTSAAASPKAESEPGKAKPPVIGGSASSGNVAPTSDQTPTSSPLQKSKAEQLLSEGSELYEKGDYKGAIRKLLLARDAADETSMARKDSLRLLAFSYCVTNQRQLCKTQFVSLLKIAPDFQLSRAEAGHPLWGPVYREAKLAATPSQPLTTGKPVKTP